MKILAVHVEYSSAYRVVIMVAVQVDDKSFKVCAGTSQTVSNYMIDRIANSDAVMKEVDAAEHFLPLMKSLKYVNPKNDTVGTLPDRLMRLDYLHAEANGVLAEVSADNMPASFERMYKLLVDIRDFSYRRKMNSIKTD